MSYLKTAHSGMCHGRLGSTGEGMPLAQWVWPCGEDVMNLQRLYRYAIRLDWGE